MDPGTYSFTADTGVVWEFHLEEHGDRYRWYLVLGYSYGPSTTYQFGDRPPTREEAREWMVKNDVRPLDF